MSATPQLRSAFPQTPQTHQKTRGHGSPVRTKPKATDGLKSSVVDRQESSGPLVPVEIIDAPSQRLYVVAIYVALSAWRIFDSWGASDELDSTWLFLKWNFIDGVFLFSIQALRIPWLEWAFPTFLAIFLLHAAANVFLMFRIPLPVGTWAGILVKMVYDRELSISERSVKPADIIYNASLILGKQIIHILPEGSATLNPDRVPFCLGPQQSSIALPIRINQTTPVLIELLRYDLHTGQNETITISSKQLKQLKRQADKRQPQHESPSHRDLLFPVRKTGIYRLQRVLDESNLEVQTRVSDTPVVSCPKALLKTSHSDKCRGDLSDLTLEVEGTPPMKIKYSRRVNGLDGGFSFQNIQPESLRSPLLNRKHDGLLINSNIPDLVWAQSQRLEIPLNESLNAGGEWVYAIEEVHDACGNVANYSSYLDEMDRASTKALPQWHQFSVHERPRLSFAGCNAQKFLEVAKDDSIELPIRFYSVGRNYDNDAPFQVTYSFSDSDVSDNPSVSKVRQVHLKNIDLRPRIKEQGWYTLNTVSSRFCSGEILEPSSCFLHHPPEPELTIRHEKVFDKCANNSVGLLVDLDLVGSPPFRLRYSIENERGMETHLKVIEGLRGQLDFTPSEAGHYRYRFLDIADNVYGARSLKDKLPLLEQDVKPPASAHFLGPREIRKACFGEPVSVDVSFVGEAPWTLQYELVHNGKKVKQVLNSDSELATISTEPLLSGGEYILSLTSVKDRSNCKRILKESIQIEVWPKKPHASFGLLDEKRNTLALENSVVELPLRLSGQAPWTVKFRNLNSSHPTLSEKTLWDENGAIEVSQEGLYELVEVSDATCPGTIDQSARLFEISWIPRPRFSALDGSDVKEGDSIAKRDVCEGDNDVLELKLSGSPPYNIKYEQQRKSDHGTSLVRVQSLKSALDVASLDMDTSRAGEYVYKFTELSDSLYDYDPKKHSSVSVTQKVNPLPSARFEFPGHIYAFCKEDSDGDEVIPIVLEGVPPFSLEITIKHHSNSKPEIVTIPHIGSHRHNLPIPRRHLELGQHVVSIHKVRDARRCQRTFDRDASSVRVAVSDVPTIIPLESQSDYCVGERISFSLSGHAPFEVFYTFDGIQRRAVSQSTNFRRIAEKPGNFTITAVSDGASGRCKAHKNITKVIHEMPSVRISKGQISVVDIHEGREAEINFEFWGTPPFEFTYTRSSNARKGKKSEILDVKHDISYEHRKTIKTSDEGTYEVVAIKDKFCSFSTQKPLGKIAKTGKALQN
ncbi:hypothetical protein VTN96DRAFT_493 [Rasamsonia emersonii]